MTKRGYPSQSERKPPTLSIRNKLRAQESYYDTQKISDKLYADSKNGKKFDKLYELIIDEKNIVLAYRNIKKNRGSKTAGTDENTVENYKDIHVEELVRIVQERLKTYIPQTIRRVYIEKANGKLRPLGIPTFEDRLIQQCFKQILEPIVEAKFYKHSYGFRALRSTKHALARMHSLINTSKLYYCVDVDIKSFFDKINHKKLLKQLWQMGIRDKQVLRIICKMLKAEIKGEGIPKAGVPQGGILSTLLSNVALNELDWWIDSQWSGMKTKHPYRNNSDKFSALKKKSKLKEMYIIRYADDFKILCRTNESAKRTFKAVKMWLKERLMLEVSEEKSKVVNLKENYSEFLGVKIKAEKKRKNRVAISKVCDKAKEKIQNELKEKFRNLRKYRHSPDRLIDELNTKIIGYHNYYRVATRVNIDFSEIAFKLSKLTYNKLKNLANIGNHKECKSKYITEKYLKSNNYKKYKIREQVLIPIGYVQHKPLMSYSQELNIYSAKGRECVGYQKLMLEYFIREIYNNSSKRLPTELVDNSISKISAQMGICFVSGEFTDEGEIHHIISVNKGGTHTYSNLIYVNKTVYFLLNSNDLKECSKLFKTINNNSETNPEKMLKEINKFREKADKLPVKIAL